ncbi:heme/hemin ABC transporter substrate-binding protein [Ancylobacter pratisalsi]|uniref:ABC transporter substrate-binding protein n=1 Tax=Ancylobacter pratisalsi TaxID=1745854 RepID=A0A6P1YR07_9HYPH|nr:ABC transporter substrate-binding protein [Ancylobacter pratisalsi]QIB35562.1 ABC transporter substrate-binding protein [Ancylobacter pratisalsi]
MSRPTPGSRTTLLSLVALLAVTIAPFSQLQAEEAAHSTASEARRVVAIGGSVTEILFALGLGDRVIAVDTSSTYPPEAVAERPNVGYIRALSPEGVLSVGPDLIIAQEGAGPPDAVAVLKGASIPFETIAEARDAKGVIANIQTVATLMGTSERGEALAEAVKRDFLAVAAMRETITARRTATFVLSAAGTTPIVAGSGTGADAMLALAGVDNAMKAMSGYKPAVDEAVLAADPSAIILMKDRGHGLTDAAVAQMPAFAGTQAIANGRLYRIDGGYLLNFGPRTPQAARHLATLIYPEHDFPTLPAHPWTNDQDVP